VSKYLQGKATEQFYIKKLTWHESLGLALVWLFGSWVGRARTGVLLLSAKYGTALELATAAVLVRLEFTTLLLDGAFRQLLNCVWLMKLGVETADGKQTIVVGGITVATFVLETVGGAGEAVVLCCEQPTVLVTKLSALLTASGVRVTVTIKFIVNEQCTKEHISLYYNYVEYCPSTEVYLIHTFWNLALFPSYY